VRRVLLPIALIALAAVISAQKPDEVLVNFAGALKTITKKEIVIEPEEGNDVRFVRSKRTRFLDKNGKPRDELEFRPGDPVTVEAFEKLNRELEAVNVRAGLSPEPD
jgi:hypothetical protein